MLMHPAHQQLLRTLLPVSVEPPLALVASVVQSLGGLSHVGAYLRLQESNHLRVVKQVSIAVWFFGLLKLVFVLADSCWIVDTL
jgi:hypothetical protein